MVLDKGAGIAWVPRSRLPCGLGRGFFFVHRISIFTVQTRSDL